MRPDSAQPQVRNENLEDRDSLIRQHMGLVRHVARRLSRHLSAEVDFDEMVSAGSLGLLNALANFDPSRGLAFSTFAAPRIRGAILDELRRQDHMPRSVRRKDRELAAARETLRRVKGREPDNREVADHLNLPMDTYWRWQSATEAAVPVPLDCPRARSEFEMAVTLGETLADDAGNRIEELLNREQEVEILRHAIEELKEQERVVLSLYYFEELKLREIASILHLTESRVSQIRSKAISKLQSSMAPLREMAA